MKKFDEAQLKIFKQILQLNAEQTLRVMSAYIESKYKKVEATRDYIIAEGDIPIALVAHVDTVFPLPPSNIYYDREENVMWAPTGAGFDDRAGVYMILQLLQMTKLRPHIILTTDEERGGVGAYTLTEKYNLEKGMFFNELKYLIQLDRQGSNDCVFYDCINRDFINYISLFGFHERVGSFSDISFLCPAWEKCGVNLSVGYFDEHTTNETLNVSYYFSTFQKVKRMLMSKDIPDFAWQERAASYFKNLSEYYASSSGYKVICKGCHKSFENEETIPVKARDGATCYYCIDCLGVTEVNWCEQCGEPFETNNPEAYYCSDCARIKMYDF